MVRPFSSRECLVLLRKCREECARHLESEHFLGPVAAREIKCRPGQRGRLLKGPAAIAPILIVRRGKVIDSTRWRLLPQDHQAAGIFIRKRADENGIDQGENGRVRANAERQRNY